MNFRKIFAERNYNVCGRVLPYEQFKPFCDKEQGFVIDPGHIPALIERAEKIDPNKVYPVMPASEYMMYKRDGNRSIYESKFFERRDDLLRLAVAEYVEGKGRFLDQVINLVWMILEETTWVLPAHNQSKPGVNCCLPYAYVGDVDYIDLFSATTGADLAWVYYLLHDRLAEVTTIVTDRMLYELDRRIIKPFLNPVYRSTLMWWTGVNGNTVNNWCPWVTSNVLTVAALTVKDAKVREVVVRESLPILDCFISVYHDDGGCDEGPSYWSAAGGALFNACEVLYDMTGGYVNIFDDPLMRAMGEYAVKVVVNGNRALNFADSPARVNPSPILLYEWGVRSGSEMMRSFGQNRLGGNLCGTGMDSSLPYRQMGFLVNGKMPACDFVAPLKFWMDGIMIAGTRENHATDKGLYLAFKGGNNNESHNHNDVGNLIVFSDGKPVFIDAGSGTYTRKTFSRERYSIWAMRSEYHNVATFNGVTQTAGAQARATDPVYDSETGKLTLNLKTAYPEQAGIDSYTRSAVLQGGLITVEDDVKLLAPGEVMFSLITTVLPEDVTDSSFTVNGATVRFDPSLRYAVEALDKTEPEVERIPKSWDTDVLYRVTLTSAEKTAGKKYVMTVGKACK